MKLPRSRALFSLGLFWVLTAPSGAWAGTGQPPKLDFLGPWEGAIEVAGRSLQIVVVFTEGPGGLAATIDIPEQGARGLRLQDVRRDGPVVHFELAAGPGLAVFDGKLEGSSITGDFTQGGVKGSFRLARKGAEAAGPSPAPEPLPYREEEVSFSNGDVRLAGTLTVPFGEGPFPAVVMLTGSGPQNRDEELFGFKPFRVIADHLTRHGVAVLRYDDRGVGASTGSTADATTEDFAADALAALAHLAARPDIDAKRIGLLGHSEGALAAAMAAARSPRVAFIVMLAGTAVPGEQIVRAQAEAIARAQGATASHLATLRAQQDLLFKAVRTGDGWDALAASARALGREQIEALPDAQRRAIADPDQAIDAAIEQQLAAARTRWYRFFIDYDPAQALAGVTCPVLALFGSLDLQVPAEMNRRALAAALARAGNRDVTIKTYEGANHLFIKAVTGSPAEYPTLEKQFVPGLLDDVTSWILARAR
jgi:pimeloyl-ACP methyl ester carboxylesterase